MTFSCFDIFVALEMHHDDVKPEKEVQMCKLHLRREM